MANLAHEGLAVLKRIGRYFQAHHRMIQRIERCGLQSELHRYADSDWAGDKNHLQVDERRSIDMVLHALKTRATSQSTIAQSSGEDELCAMTKMAVQKLKGVMSLASDFWSGLPIRLPRLGLLIAKGFLCKMQTHQCPVFVDSRGSARRTAWKE